MSVFDCLGAAKYYSTSDDDYVNSGCVVTVPILTACKMSALVVFKGLLNITASQTTSPLKFGWEVTVSILSACGMSI